MIAAMPSFKPTAKFKKNYRRIYRKDPEAANMLLLLCELADRKGQFETSDEELARLYAARFNDPKEYAL